MLKLIGGVIFSIFLGALFVLGLGLIFVPTLGEVIEKVKEKTYIFAMYMFILIALMAVVLLMGIK